MAPVLPVAGGGQVLSIRVFAVVHGVEACAVGDLPEARSAKGCKDYQEVTSGAIFQPYGVKIDGLPSRQEAVAP